MRTVIIILLTALLFASCADSQEITFPDGTTKEVPPYGVFGRWEQVPGVEYGVSPESLVWSIVGFETIIVPVWLVGWNLWEPLPNEMQPWHNKEFDPNRKFD